MIYGSVCSGIEAATVAWHPLGWTPAFFSEIEPFPSRVLAHHYPDVPNRGDMTKFKDWPDAALDVLVGGTPCQSFSVAGLRKGMADPRGNLALVYLAMADRYRPRWLVWENVPGVLSSNGGRDFGAFLGGLVELGYGFAYRVLDAQYFGLAQRRKRVFVVGHLGDWRRAAAVLLERESLRGNPAPRREAREGTAGRTVASVALRGRDGGAAAEVGDDCGFALRASQGGGEKPHVLTWPAEVASTLNAAFGDKQGLEDQHALGGGNCSFPLIGGVFDDANGGDVPQRGRHGPADAESETLIPTGGCFDVADTLRSHPRPGSATFGALAFSCKDHGADAGDVAPTLRSMGHDGSHANGGGQLAVAFAHQGGGVQTTLGYDPDIGTAPTLSVCQTPAVHQSVGVRRLTPRECERLQGFPDDYTLIPGAKDGPRYKALGNSMAVPCMAWIGRRIAEVDALEINKTEAA